MLPEDKKILEKLAQEVRRIVPGARLWIFGSRARGDAVRGSDFDLFIVLPTENKLAESAIKDLCWETGFENERVVTSIIVDREQFENGPISESSLVDNILREGISA